MLSNDGASAPSRRISTSSSRANSDSVGRSIRRWRMLPRAVSAMAQAASMRAISPSSFTRRSSAIRPSVDTSSAVPNHVDGELLLLGPRDVVGLQRQPVDALGRGRDRLLLGGLRTPDVDAGGDARPTELVGGPFLIAAVGDEQHLVGQDQQQGRGSR